MHPHTKFGIPALKNIGRYALDTKQDGRADGQYASLSSFAGIKTTCTPMKQHNSKKVMFIFSLHIHILSERVYVIVVKFIGGIMFTL